MSKFSDWTLTKLDKRFGLQQVFDLESLNRWLSSDVELSEIDRAFLLNLKQKATIFVESWNEQEYWIYVIGPLLNYIDFTEVNFAGLSGEANSIGAEQTSKNYTCFVKRFLIGKVDGEEISGYPDGLVASGWREPETSGHTRYSIHLHTEVRHVYCMQHIARTNLNQHRHTFGHVYFVGREII